MLMNTKIPIDRLRLEVAARRPVRDAAADLSATPGSKFDADLKTLMSAIETYAKWKKEDANVDA
jgi:hypothetical protein